MNYPRLLAFLVISFTVPAVKAQSLSADSLLSLVKQAYIYGYPVEQSYRMYVTLPDNTGQTKRIYNHFSYAGHWGTHYREEALYIKQGFYAGNTDTESFYIIPKSREGKGFFNGNHTYKIHFAKDAFPPLHPGGFWSITANEIPGYFLLPNPIHRAAIRDRTKSLAYNADGSLDIYIQADSPGPGKEANWLPITKHESTVTFRVYLPKEALLTNKHKLPPIDVVE